MPTSRTAPGPSRRALGALLGLATAATLWATPPVGALPRAAAEPPQPAAGVLEDSRARAVEVLEEVREVVAAPADGEVTVALAELHEVYDALPAPERRLAAAMLARPTDAAIDPQHDLLAYRRAPVGTHCSTHACIHWTETGKHRVTGADAAATDKDLATVPSWVLTTLQAVEDVWAAQVDTMGFRRPRGDRLAGNPAGNTTKGLLDVYLGELGSAGYYGYANWDPQAPRGSYLVLDNDFAEFQIAPDAAMRATVAHEFFHTVQFAYHLRMDPWLLESSATWMEELLHTDVNDNRQYLRYGSLREPAQPLDVGGFAAYGNWIFFHHLALVHGDELLREVMELAAGGRNHSLRAIDKALKARGTNLADAFADFSAANVVRATSYPEGASYPRPRQHRVRRLGKAARDTGWLTDRLDHLAASDNPVRPAAKLRAGWRLRIDVRRTDKRQRARVVVHRADGTTTVERLRFTGSDARLRLDLGSTPVRKVTVTLANGSSRLACDRGTEWTCRGTPRDDGRAIRYRARLTEVG